MFEFVKLWSLYICKMSYVIMSSLRCELGDEPERKDCGLTATRLCNKRTRGQLYWLVLCEKTHPIISGVTSELLVLKQAEPKGASQ